MVETDPRPLYFGKYNRYPFYGGLGGVLGPVWMDAENIALIGFRSSDRPVLSESLCRLRYTGPQLRTETQTEVTQCL
jgi:hypothetical protein